MESPDESSRIARTKRKFGGVLFLPHRCAIDKSAWVFYIYKFNTNKQLANVGNMSDRFLTMFKNRIQPEPRQGL
jgi:hypothetical protein